MRLSVAIFALCVCLSVFTLAAEPVGQPDTKTNDGALVEQVPPNEAEQIRHIVSLTIDQLRNRYSGDQLVRRGVHAKDHGCVKAEFKVVDDLPAPYRIGVFSEPGRQFEAWVRFSNAATLVQPDNDLGSDGKRVPGSRGMAIKLLGVSGTPLVPPNGGQTQDFLLVNHPVFAFANVEDYQVLSSVLADPANQEKPDKFFALQLAKTGPSADRARRTLEIVGRIQAADVASGAFQRQPASPVDCRYFSGAPFLFGEEAVMKYSAVPVDPEEMPAPDYEDANYLRKALIKRL